MPDNSPAPGVALIGCGLVGQKRLHNLPSGSVVVACDLNLERARKLASLSPGCQATDSVERAVAAPEVKVVMVATLNASLTPVAAQAVQAGKHVLVEKPGGISLQELEQLEALSQRHGVLVRLGYNHRYHPACLKALEIFRSGALGPMMFVRGRYGQGGRVGYDKEWRAVEEISGGGEAIDQGMHLIDLARWFLGDFNGVQGHVATYFWDMPVEDNAFFLLTTPANQTAQLHATWTEWKNLFSLEIYGRDGKLDITGLGGSYGIERLAYYKMLPEMGPPETTIWEYPGLIDRSWGLEFSAFLQDIADGREPSPGVRDAQAALRIVESVYERCGR